MHERQSTYSEGSGLQDLGSTAFLFSFQSVRVFSAGITSQQYMLCLSPSLLLLDEIDDPTFLSQGNHSCLEEPTNCL